MYELKDLIWRGTADKISSGAVVPDLEELKDRYTLKSRYSEDFCLYAECSEKGKMLVPRNLVKKYRYDDRVSGTHFKIKSRFKARNAEQATLVEQGKFRIDAGKSFILSAPTGSGKSYIGTELGLHAQTSVLIIVNKEDLAEQWIKAILACTKLAPDQIGRINGARADHGKPFTIGMIQSLCKYNRYPKKIYHQFGMVIADEVHLLAADKFQQCMYQLPARLRLGLSATPHRRDGRDIVIRAHIGEVEVVGKQLPMKPKIYMLDSRWKLPMTRDRVTGKIVPVTIPVERMTIAAKYMKKSYKRNSRVCAVIANGYKKGRNILVLSESLEHLDNMREMLRDEYAVHPNDLGIYVGGMKSYEREVSLAKRVVLATYAMASTGTDAPWLDMLVMATPRSNVEQIIGRVTRFDEGKPQPVVIDFVDARCGALARTARKRRIFYRTKGFEVEDKSV